MAAPTKEALKQLYNATLRTSQSFSSYNFRNYFVRRTENVFKEIENETDPTKLATFYDQATQELAVMKRSAVVNQLYGGSKLVVEEQKVEHERADS